jgi:hypothetical protein
MSEVLESKKPGAIYSIDLSAAFDLLIPGKFFQLFKHKISEGFMFSLMDFLQNRTFHVEVDSSCSNKRQLDRGCVQGSVLGPRLFSMYVGALESELVSVDPNIRVISFTDDTYVIICDDSWELLKQKTENVLNHHVNYLKDLGMIVNESKTELMTIGECNRFHFEVNIAGSCVTAIKSMKALGIIYDGNLNWDKQAEKAIKKGNTINLYF